MSFKSDGISIITGEKEPFRFGLRFRFRFLPSRFFGFPFRFSSLLQFPDLDFEIGHSVASFQFFFISFRSSPSSSSSPHFQFKICKQVKISLELYFPLKIRNFLLKREVFEIWDSCTKESESFAKFPREES